jgi:hypothetical protein
MCAARPRLASHYTPAFCRLLLRGAAESEQESAATHGLGEEEAAGVGSPLDPHLDHLYTRTAMAPRVAALCYLRRLARIHQSTAESSQEEEERRAAGRAGHAIWVELLRMTSGAKIKKISSRAHVLVYFPSNL